MDDEDKKDFKPLNLLKKNERPTAVALRDRTHERSAPEIMAAGRGKIAERILALAFENDIPVREDSALVEILAKIEIDSPIPTETFGAVAEILSYVYRANGQPNPFEAFSYDDIEDCDDE